MRTRRRVALLGFRRTERMVLESIFALSARREVGFERLDDEAVLPDAFLVDAEDSAALATHAARDPQGVVPAVLVGRSDAGTGRLRVSRPLQWVRLLGALDEALGIERALPPRGIPGPGLPTASDDLPARRAPPDGDNLVLVVGADTSAVELLLDRLEPSRWKLHLALDAGEAAALLEEGRSYRCAFLSPDLPGFDAYRVCQRLKTRRDGAPSVVVLMPSRGGDPRERLLGRQAGCDDFLPRPLDPERLDALLRRYLVDDSGSTDPGNLSPAT